MFIIMIQTVMITQASEGLPLKDKYANFIGSTSVDEYIQGTDQLYYSEIVDEYQKKGYQSATSNKEVHLGKIKNHLNQQISLTSFEDRDNVFIWSKEIPFIQFEIEIPETGLYQIEMEYFMMQESSNEGVRSILINNQHLFIESNNLSFPRIFKDANEPVINSLGDETRPSQVEVPGWRRIRLMDSTGMVTAPFKFYLTQGTHHIQLEYIEGSMAISSIAFVECEEILSYQEVKQIYEGNQYQKATQSIEFQAESTAIEKTDPTLRRESDGDPTVVPRSIATRKLNTIGGYRWRKGNQSITWDFTVPEDGLYKIGVRNIQLWNDGLPSYRQIAIDGQVPFQELLEYKFPYHTAWTLEELQDEKGEVFEFFLKEGQHTLTMTVKFGPLTPIIESLNEDNLLLSKMLMDIIKITGSNPDPNYDYDFFNKIPTLKDDMQTLADSLQWKHDYVKTMSEKNTAMGTNFITIKKQLESMIKNPYSIAKKMNDLNTAQSSLGDWYLQMQSQPLMIDYFKVGPSNEKWKNKKASIFEKLRTATANFIVSFKKDYDNVGGILNDSVEVKETINVWVARGTEWAEVIKEMADEDFTTQTGIMVNINVLPAAQLTAGSVNALMLSITSGRAPDVALGVDVNSPVEFAIRDAVYDLSQMDGFEEVKSRFLEGIMIPYEYNGGVYALPETMDFNVMFYRKDILNELSISLPDTRQDLYSYVLPLLYQNGLEFSYSKDFTQLLFQHGGQFYTEDGLRSGLDTPEAYRAFLELTEMYTNYSVPIVANFYNRMRTGEMPLGIGNFGVYMQLSVAAPELAGKWGIAPLPGMLQRDGVIDRSCGGLTGQGDIILKQSEKPEASWEFLKWWSSTSTQEYFAREVEALMGAEARWNTANIEAFRSLSWKESDLNVLEEQWRWAKETPIVLGGYFTTRHIDNAWTSVVMNGANVRDSLEVAVKEINKELRMKQEEYGVFANEHGAEGRGASN
ncbi:MAG: extracellular solute-binding protein [Epulopiscium sp.]|nr:extracellular solute-binding protein [Candidatus Epulonipiscium sp.]